VNALPTDPLLTMPKAAQIFGRSAEWVKARCDAGELRHWLSKGRRYTTAAAIVDYLDRSEGRARKRVAAVVPAAAERADRAAAERLRQRGLI
jgi:hypothetical protein